MFSDRLELDGLHILVVEDDLDTREAMTLLLQQFGASVTAAASARDGLRALGLLQPDILLSDLSMPGEDGYDLIRQVRALPPDRGGRIPAAAVTARTSAEDRRRTRAAGFQAHLAKPLDADELASVVARLVGRAAATREHESPAWQPAKAVTAAE
jgi:CheY-like chemotaxis protein